MSRFSQILDNVKAEIIAIALALIIYLLAYYGLQEQIEFLPPILFFLAGAFTTAVIQHRFQVEFEKRKIKREDAITMRDKIYGPIFREMSKSLESVESGEGPKWDNIEELKEMMRNNFFFFKIRPDLKTRFYALVERLEKYHRIHSATVTLVLHKIKDAVAKFHKRDISVSLNLVRLSLDMVKGAIQLDSINLEQTILKRIPPSDFIKTAKEVWKDAVVNVWIAGGGKKISDFEALHKTVLDEMEKELLCQTEKKERNSLIEELETFLNQIKDFITVQ